MPANKLRLIHTSDTHLGDITGHPQSADALTAVVDSVADNGGDMLLLVGDIFDNERVSDDVLNWFLGEMERLKEPAVVLPGNHDLIHETSVYRREPFNHAPENLFVLKGTEGETLSFPGMGIDLWGEPCPCTLRTSNPFKGCRRPWKTTGWWPWPTVIFITLKTGTNVPLRSTLRKSLMPAATTWR